MCSRGNIAGAVVLFCIVDEFVCFFGIECLSCSSAGLTLNGMMNVEEHCNEAVSAPEFIPPHSSKIYYLLSIYLRANITPMYVHVSLTSECTP